MIANHYGKRVSLTRLRAMTESNKQGISLNDIKQLFHEIGMESEAMRISQADVRRMPLPAIIFWNQNHFVVLHHIDQKNRMFYVADPDEGKLKLNETDFTEHWKQEGDKGIVVVAEPGENFSTQTENDEPVHKRMTAMLTNVFTRHRRQFLTVMAMSLICMLADLLMPVLMQTTVDRGIENHNPGLVWLLAGFQMMVLLGNVAATNIIQFLSSKLALIVNMNMMRDYLTKLLALPLAFFDSKSSADLIQKLEDQMRLKGYIIQFPTTILTVALNTIVFMGLLIWYNYFLFIIFICFTALEIGWNILFLKKRKELDYNYYRYAAKNQNMVYEAVNGITDIKTAGASQPILDSWGTLQEKIVKLGIKSTNLGIWTSGGQSVISGLKSILLTAICSTLVIYNKLTIGEMLAVGYVIGRLSGPFSSILSMVRQTQDAQISYERIDEVMSAKIAPVPANEKLTSDIDFSNVWFRYAGKSSAFVIKNLSHHIPAGKTTAIVGESGCGKTTLLKLIMGLYTPQKGQLRLGGYDIENLNQSEWLDKCSIVMQNGYIFSDTIMKNISISDEETDFEMVKKAAEIAGISEFIETLPLKYHTLIGSTGMELSGGQKQRILIARALYKKPEILILDEATSSLDAANEALITARIMQFQMGKTMIIAAHRLSTVRNADNIIFMANGEITEQGTHQQLIALRGNYYNLVSSQL